MAMSMEQKRQILSRHATTVPSNNHDTETSPLTLEVWMSTSGIIETLSSSSRNVEISFEDREIMEASDTDKVVSPQCSIHLSVISTIDDLGSILVQRWDLVSLDYNEAEIWQALSPSIQKLRLTCLPEFLRGQLSHLQHLELDSRNYNVNDDMDDRSDCGEPTRTTTEQVLFTSEELSLLVDLLESPLCRLESLYCISCHFGQDVVHSFFQAMVTNQTLQRATLQYCNLAGSCEGNKVIDAERCSNILGVLRIDQCTLDDGAMHALVEMLTSSPSLEQFVFLKAEVPLSAGRLIAQSLVDHCKLESLDLSGLDVDEDGVEAIGNLVKASNGMKTLNLSELPQVIDVSFLADALLSNTTLIQLDLSSNRLSHGDTLSKALETNQTLQHLNLSRATWEEVDDSTDDTCMAVPSFYTSLGGCRGLLHLDLSYMYLSPQNVSELAASLRQNNSLERLLLKHLDRTSGPVQLEFVFDALRANAHLRVLELGGNSFRQDEIQSLLESLSANGSLESLTLSGCGLTDDVIVQISRSLPKLSLKDLDLCFNDFGRGGATAILEILPKTSTLRSLSLFNSCWSIGGPAHFDCDGFEDVNQAIQDGLNQRNG